MSDSKAFGEFSGEKEDYPAFKEDIAAYKTINYEAEFKGYEGAVRPKDRDRITAEYTVAEGVFDDPTGARPGEKVAKERDAAAQTRNDRRWQLKDQLWFANLGSRCKSGRALRAKLKLAQQGQRSGRLLEKALDMCYEEKTARHAGHLLRQWVGAVRPPSTPVDVWTEQWEKDRNVINSNLNWDQIQCIFYLTSLGPSHQNYFDIKAQDDTMDMDDLQRGAPDFRRGVADEDPALLRRNATGVALAATETEGNYTNATRNTGSWTAMPCAGCHHPWHCQRDCFKPGGGLSHLSHDERQDWLDMKRKRRERKNGGGGTKRHRSNGDGDTGQAMLAAAALEGQHRTKMQKIHDRLKEHGLESDFTEFFES